MPQIPRESEDPAVTDQEIWMEADERLRISMEANGENNTNAIEDLEFEDGNQWPDDLYNQRNLSKRPTLTINMTRRCVREVCNNMRQQRPRIKVHPTGDGARVEDAKVWAGLIRDIENKSRADYAYDTAGESAVKIGWGYARVLAKYVRPDSNEQELEIRAVRNVFTIYDDPYAQLPSGADREWLLLTEEMSRQKYKRKYPRAENAEWRAAQAGDTGRLWESKSKIRLAEYFRVTKKPEWLYTMTDGTAVYEKDLAAHQLAGRQVKVDPVTGEPERRKSYRRYIEWFLLNGLKIVDRRALGGERSGKGPLPGFYIPFSRCLGNLLEINGQIRLRGMVRDLKDSNRMLNYWATCETELVALAPRAPFIAAVGQLDGHPEWKDANQKPYSSLTYNVVHSNPENPESAVLPPPVRQEAVQIPAGVVNARQGALQDLMALAGMPHDPRADVPGAVVSGRALRERQALTDRSHFQYYDNQTQFICHIGEILVDQIPHYYSAPRTQRIIGEDGVPQMVGLNQPVAGSDGAVMEIQNAMNRGRFSVVMDTGPGYETKRQEGQEAVIDLLKTPLAEPIVKTGADLIVRNMDFAGADDLADRLLPTNPQGLQKAVQQLPKEAQGIVQALMTQNQQKDQLIQGLQLELKYKMAATQTKEQAETEREQMRDATKRRDTDVRAHTELTKQAMGDTTKRDVAEIHGATELLNTNTEAAHDRAAARELVKNAAQAEKRPNGAA